ncbi:MAG TPA: DUF167 domain-containing protein [Syntrophomonadaceae bacterium]|nr:DUF167 domain-containing protein [Syntrophomonadaceae bacterium]HNX29155.1 DUF167 domain-containing protein [Syntrophomonadaceae bacterium]HPR93672.1 DUF167 domain-containing protein [Syntrophomonadaceae bacterium]
MLEITDTSGGIRLEIKVQPRSAKNMIVGEQAGKLKLKITAPPVEGEANKMLIEFLAHYFQLPKKSITIIKGDSSTHKLIELQGITREEFINKLPQ